MTLCLFKLYIADFRTAYFVASRVRVHLFRRVSIST